MWLALCGRLAGCITMFTWIQTLRFNTFLVPWQAVSCDVDFVAAACLPMCDPDCCDVSPLLRDGLDSLQHTKLVLNIQKRSQLIQQQQLGVLS